MDWKNTTLNTGDLINEVQKMKEQNGKSISAGSLSIASALAQKKLIDEYWFLVHPVVAGKGRRLFERFEEGFNLKLIDTKIFKSGVVVLHYGN